MAKFTIECPRCGKYAEGRTGFFSKKTVQCACGNVINVKTDKMSATQCPHCGNQAIYDQAKGDRAKCPVCRQPLGSSADKARAEKFRCPQCSCTLYADTAAASYVCPICDHVIDVQKAISLQAVAKEGLASVIKYEGDNNTFVWKHPVEDFNIGSQLIVHESQEAVFFRDGQALDSFIAGRYTLETQSIPLINSIYDSQLGPSGMFHSEVYFINMTTQMAIKWGTDSKVRLFDPATGIPIEIGARGEFNIRVIEPRKLLIKLVGTESLLDRSQLLSSSGSNAGGAGAGTEAGVGAGVSGGPSGYFRSFIMTRVKSYLARTIKEAQINILEVDEHLNELSEALHLLINQGLEEYGLMMPQFYVEQVQTPDDDPNFKLLKQQHAEMFLRPRQEAVRQAEAVARREREIVEQQTAAQLQIIEAQGRGQSAAVEAHGTAEAYRLMAQAEAAEMQMKGYSYQDETARQVGLEAMQNGITGGGSGGGGLGGLGDVVGLGVALGAMGGVIGMTKDALGPMIGGATELGQGFGGVVGGGTGASSGGQTPSGQGGGVPPGSGSGSGQPNPYAAGVFGSTANDGGVVAQPHAQAQTQAYAAAVPQAASWDCACGAVGITSAFCPKCGSKCPEPPVPAAPQTWDCPACPASGLTSGFCPDCGTRCPSAAPLASAAGSTAAVASAAVPLPAPQAASTPTDSQEREAEDGQE